MSLITWSCYRLTFAWTYAAAGFLRTSSQESPEQAPETVQFGRFPKLLLISSLLVGRWHISLVPRCSSTMLGSREMALQSLMTKVQSNNHQRVHSPKAYAEKTRGLASRTEMGFQNGERGSSQSPTRDRRQEQWTPSYNDSSRPSAELDRLRREDGSSTRMTALQNLQDKVHGFEAHPNHDSQYL